METLLGCWLVLKKGKSTVLYIRYPDVPHPLWATIEYCSVSTHKFIAYHISIEIIYVPPFSHTVSYLLISAHVKR